MDLACGGRGGGIEGEREGIKDRKEAGVWGGGLIGRRLGLEIRDGVKKKGEK